MPTTREEHIIYTRKELENMDYYKNIISILNQEGITSYVDVGANVGEYCKVLLEKIPTLNFAYLIEPEEQNFKFLLKNLEGVSGICNYNSAISYSLNNPKLVQHSSNNVGGYMVIENGESGLDFINETLENLKIPIVDFLKMDVEGSEFNIIENSEYIKNIKFLDIEFHVTPEELNSGHIENFIKNNLPTYSITIFDGVRFFLTKTL